MALWIGANVADSNVRWGFGGRDRGDVDGNQRWVRVGYFLASAARCKPCSHQTCALGFRIGGSSVFFTSHSGIIVGVMFLMLTRRYRPYPMSIVRVWLWWSFILLGHAHVDQLNWL